MLVLISIEWNIPVLGDFIALLKDVIAFPPLAEVSRSDGGGYCRDGSNLKVTMPEQSELRHFVLRDGSQG